jgi:P27 family predicted phage terminase small subunit
MKTGPRRKPLEVEIYQGNPSHRPKSEMNGRLEADTLTHDKPLQFLDASAAKEWQRVVPYLTKYKILTDMDVNALAMYCQSWSDYLKYTDDVRKLGAIYKTKSGQIKPRPETMLRRIAWAEVIRICAEFGFTPSARAGMQLTMTAARKSTAQLLDELDDSDEV